MVVVVVVVSSQKSAVSSSSSSSSVVVDSYQKTKITEQKVKHGGSFFLLAKLRAGGKELKRDDDILQSLGFLMGEILAKARALSRSKKPSADGFASLFLWSLVRSRFQLGNN